ncbi:hypothetical protein Mal64_14420 [Pseudobythopirellula maris]|uniref:Uncharacterized protein n=1 Tax=Pseudobythopirellula maris TaxID=2527991 RepID=A0A5C5ZXQ3_9BACT|nr:glycoside hydrolase family 95 protein [Pseudobythopirellula maris]TWT91043.1 hypothetical protein Mal64_14420 [Pseudobythopirellula maris]
MRKTVLNLRTASVCAGLLAAAFGSALHAHGAEQELWYATPAQQWTEALPVGNGRLGAMVFGGAQEARVQFNEDSLWSGGPHDYAHPGAHEHLAEIRRLLLEGKQREAEELASREFMSVPIRQCNYLPFGDVTLRFPEQAEANDYRRSLDLDRAITTTTYKSEGVRFKRRVFASFPDQAIVIYLDADQPKRLAFELALTSPHAEHEVGAPDERTLRLTGRAPDYVDKRNKTPIEGKERFAAFVRVVECDGEVTHGDDGPRGKRLSVKGASRATIVLTAATSHVSFQDVSADAQQRALDDLEAAGQKPVEDLMADHINDHRELFRRVALDLGETPHAELPTDERVLASKETPDPALAALFFDYGRYLLIASSRAGGQPPNLQGVWNEEMNPSWGSKYTTNINAEMNHWPVEPCNLPECLTPLVGAMQELAESGRRTAHAHYDLPGWVLHHNFDLWRGTAPINASNHGIWPSGGAWLCLHLWDRYLHSGDEAFLRETAYPLMRGAAEFFADYLIVDPRSEEGWLISGPSNSPEQGGLVMGPTMDHQIIRALLSSTAEAARVLGVDDEFATKLDAIAALIAPNQIGRLGQLQEWLEDKDDPNSRHRHVSHLWGLYPGAEITPDTPELFAAAEKSLDLRGDGGTGWSRAWKVNFWARLRNGDRAHKVLDGLLTLTGSPKASHRGGGVYPNLFDAHPPFQIDGNFGATAGVCEMLVQSHRRTAAGETLVDLLPALPSAWPEGKVERLRTRGGFEVSIVWREGQLDQCRVRSLRGEKAALRCGDAEAPLALAQGEEAVFDARLNRIE